MSLSNPTEKITNPSKLFLEWNNEGFFTFYDKEVKEKISFDLPMQFYVLDSLIQIKGYDAKLNKGYWSNAIRPSMKETAIITVTNDTGKIAEGKLSLLKDSEFNTATLLYVCLNMKNNEKTLACITIKGAVSASFFEFKKQVNIEREGVQIKSFSQEKKGASKYNVPIFEKYSDNDHRIIAIDMDKEILQPYLKEYFTVKYSI